VAYTYDLRNRLKTVTTADELEDLDGDSSVDDRQVEIVTYSYTEAGFRVIAEREEYDYRNYDDPSPTTIKLGSTETIYLIDPSNHTGYAQVFEQIEYNLADPDPANDTPSDRVTYTIADDVLTESRNTLSSPDHLIYDGHGSVRQHVDSSGSAVVYEYDPDPQTPDDEIDYGSFDYDAYGTALTPLPTTNSLFYTGEQFDSSLDQYYLRARYYDPANGRFNRTDPFAGNLHDPQSLHKYTYCHNNPVNAIDPSGQFGEFSLTGLMSTMSNIGTLMSISMPVWAPLVERAAWKLVPADVRNKVMNKIPSALLVGGGISGGATVGNTIFGASGTVAVEGLISPTTREGAIYLAPSIATQFGGGMNVSGSIYAGMVWADSASEYTGGFRSLSCIFGSLPSSVSKIIERGLLSVIGAQMASGTTGFTNWERWKLIDKISRVKSTASKNFGTNKRITFSWGYSGSGAIAITFGGEASIGNSGLNLSYGMGYSQKVWPGNNPKFRN